LLSIREKIAQADARFLELTRKGIEGGTILFFAWNFFLLKFSFRFYVRLKDDFDCVLARVVRKKKQRDIVDFGKN